MKLDLAFRMAVRGLRRDKSTSLAAIAVLALGLAAPATFFSILWGGGLRPLPVPDGGQVMRVEVRQPSQSGRPIPVTSEDLLALRAVGAFSALGAFTHREATITTGEYGALRLAVADMTPGVFELLGVTPAIGRLPIGPEAARGFVLGHEIWAETFDSDPGVLGMQISVGGVNRDIVAVMPEGFAFPFNHQAWTLVPAERIGGTLELVGRLAQDASEDLATLQTAGVWSQRDIVRPEELRGGVVKVRMFTRGRGEGGEAVAFGGLVLVGLCLLLIASANAANLLLVRAADRVQVLGVQSALGASRVQLSAQLLIEALLLASVGGISGLGLASIMVDYVQTTGAGNFGYYWMRLAVDLPVVIFTAFLVFGTAITAGMLPLVKVLRLDVQHVLKGGRALADFGELGRLLVSGQLALACGALVATGLTGRAMTVASNFGGDLPSEEILLGAFELEMERYPTPDARWSGLQRLHRAITELPATRAVGLAIGAPGFRESYGPLEVGGAVYERPDDRLDVWTNAVTPGYLTAVGLGLVSGRELSDADDRTTRPVALVSRSLALLLAENGEVLEQRIRAPRVDSAWATVVGVVEDAELGAGPRALSEVVYLSAFQADLRSAMVVMRTDGEVATAADQLRRAVSNVDPSMAVSGVQTLSDAHDFMTRAQSTLSSLAVAGGSAGLLVSAVGLFGLLSFRVRQRAMELGVRMALGADGRRLGFEVLVFALRQLIPAVVLGLAMAWVVAPALGPLLLGGDPHGVATYLAVAGVFLTVGLAAALTPATRAASVDPITALRSG